MSESDEDAAGKDQVAFFEMPDHLYPFTLQYVQHETGNVVQTIDVTGPGAMEVPYLRGKYGPIGVRMTLADGTVSYQPPVILSEEQ